MHDTAETEGYLQDPPSSHLCVSCFQWNAKLLLTLLLVMRGGRNVSLRGGSWIVYRGGNSRHRVQHDKSFHLILRTMGGRWWIIGTSSNVHAPRSPTCRNCQAPEQAAQVFFVLVIMFSIFVCSGLHLRPVRSYVGQSTVNLAERLLVLGADAWMLPFAAYCVFEVN